MVDIHEEYYEKCDYCRQSYYEHDTGYSEYQCDLTGYECMGGCLDSGCPLSFKYKIEE